MCLSFIFIFRVDRGSQKVADDVAVLRKIKQKTINYAKLYYCNYTLPYGTVRYLSVAGSGGLNLLFPYRINLDSLFIVAFLGTCNFVLYTI